VTLVSPGPRRGPGTFEAGAVDPRVTPAARVLVAGATGYVGGRLTAALEHAGVPVRCLARRPEALAGRTAPTTEIVQGDCLDPATLPAALAGVDTAYYLVHSMGSGRDFAALDETAARNFGEAARAAGVSRIVYLGGLGAARDDALSEHLRSRQQTGDVLRASGAAVVPKGPAALSTTRTPESARSMV